MAQKSQLSNIESGAAIIQKFHVTCDPDFLVIEKS